MSTADLFFQLQSELKVYQPAMKKLADKVLDEKLSLYPIFVLHKQETEIGLPIIAQQGDDLPWSINISTLEEFAHKELIVKSKLDKFKEVFKNPLDYFCVFVLSSLGAQFIFIPREN